MCVPVTGRSPAAVGLLTCGGSTLGDGGLFTATGLWALDSGCVGAAAPGAGTGPAGACVVSGVCPSAPPVSDVAAGSAATGAESGDSD